MSKGLDELKLVRRDLGNLLFHFTRTLPKVEDFLTKKVTREEKSALTVLHEILEEGCLKGSSGYILGGHNCVCFTEAPITELGPLFYLNQERKLAARYEPYGIAVPKDWLFEKGGRPVIYQKRGEYDLLPPELQFRHVTYNPCEGTDFTWEREWRLKTDKLMLDQGKTLVVVRTAEDATTLNHIHSEDHKDAGLPGRVFQKPKWMIVSLDLFGLKES